MDKSLYSGTFGFANGDGTTILTNAEMANYPYEPEQFGKTNRGRTDSGARWRYDHWGVRKHRWVLHFVNETPAVTDTLATFFNSSATFYFNPNPGESEWYNVDNADDEWTPQETFIDLFSFDVTIEEV